MIPPPTTTARASAGIPRGELTFTCCPSGRPLAAASSRTPILLLAEAVAQAQSVDTWLVGGLAQVEVTGIAVDDRVLVGEVGDVKLHQPAVALGWIQPEPQVHDRVGRLQDAPEPGVLVVGSETVVHL